jgi:hypothetical protein
MRTGVGRFQQLGPDSVDKISAQTASAGTTASRDACRYGADGLTNHAVQERPPNGQEALNTGSQLTATPNDGPTRPYWPRKIGRIRDIERVKVPRPALWDTRAKPIAHSLVLVPQRHDLELR